MRNPLPFVRPDAGARPNLPGHPPVRPDRPEAPLFGLTSNRAIALPGHLAALRDRLRPREDAARVLAFGNPAVDACLPGKPAPWPPPLPPFCWPGSTLAARRFGSRPAPTCMPRASLPSGSILGGWWCSSHTTTPPRSMRWKPCCGAAWQPRWWERSAGSTVLPRIACNWLACVMARPVSCCAAGRTG